MMKHLFWFIAAMSMLAPGAWANTTTPRADATWNGVQLAYDNSNDGRVQCFKDCYDNYSACNNTANSPEARSECQESHNACKSTCN
jgi:hypothetical protein